MVVPKNTLYSILQIVTPDLVERYASGKSFKISRHVVNLKVALDFTDQLLVNPEIVEEEKEEIQSTLNIHKEEIEERQEQQVVSLQARRESGASLINKNVESVPLVANDSYREVGISVESVGNDEHSLEGKKGNLLSLVGIEDQEEIQRRKLREKEKSDKNQETDTNFLLRKRDELAATNQKLYGKEGYHCYQGASASGKLRFEVNNKNEAHQKESMDNQSSGKQRGVLIDKKVG